MDDATLDCFLDATDNSNPLRFDEDTDEYADSDDIIDWGDSSNDERSQSDSGSSQGSKDDGKPISQSVDMDQSTANQDEEDVVFRELEPPQESLPVEISTNNADVPSGKSRVYVDQNILSDEGVRETIKYLVDYAGAKKNTHSSSSYF